MTNLELIVLALGLSMDAFAVAICKGLSMGRLRLPHMVCVGLWFGGFQALMPTLGYFLGSTFTHLIQSLDHWIAFVLLLILGGNMLFHAFHQDSDDLSPSLSPATMVLLAVATSIDALAVGVTFAFLQVDLPMAVSSIGICTFFLSAIGVGVGHAFGARFQSKAEALGGTMLILMGTKILLDHLGLLH